MGTLLLDEGILVKNAILCLRSFFEYYFARDIQFITHKKFGMSRKMKCIYYDNSLGAKSQLIIGKFDYNLLTEFDNQEVHLDNYVACYIFDDITKVIHYAIEDDNTYIRLYSITSGIVKEDSINIMTMDHIMRMYKSTIERMPSAEHTNSSIYEDNLAWIYDNDKMLSLLDNPPIIFARNLNDLSAGSITK